MTYPGGKAGSGVYQTLINQTPPHDAFISAFAGHDAVLQHKLPALRNVAIDLDPEPLKWWAEYSPAFELEIYNCCGLEWLKHEFQLSRIGQQTATVDRRKFVLIDPPYPGDTRSSGPIYKFEQMDWEFHRRLLDVACRLPCNVMICCYPNDVYDALLSDWRTVTYQSVCRSGESRTEKLWMNYPAPTELHDYRYLGGNRRERERIRRQQKTLRQKMARMSELERRAYFSVAAESLGKLAGEA